MTTNYEPVYTYYTCEFSDLTKKGLWGGICGSKWHTPKNGQASPLRAGDRWRRELTLGSSSPPFAGRPLGCAD